MTMKVIQNKVYSEIQMVKISKVEIYVCLKQMALGYNSASKAEYQELSLVLLMKTWL